MPPALSPVRPDSEASQRTVLFPNVGGTSSNARVSSESGENRYTAEEQSRSAGSSGDGEVKLEEADEKFTDDEVAEEPEVKTRRPPRSPTEEELRVHRATHVPYRNWCPHCVAARAHQSGHSQGPTPIDDVPIICLDYCF